MGCVVSNVESQKGDGKNETNGSKIVKSQANDYSNGNILSSKDVQRIPLNVDRKDVTNLDAKELIEDVEFESEENASEKESRPKWKDNEIAKVVAEKLTSQYPEWKDVNEDQMKIKDVSGQGGDSTYHVSRIVDDKVIAEVAFHVVSEAASFENHPLQLQVQKTVTNIFAGAGISPRRLADETDKLFINEWIKSAKAVDSIGNFDIDLAKQLGKLISQVHSIDIDWYTQYYQYWIEKYPDLSNVPRESSFWYLTGRNWPLLFESKDKESMDEYMKRLVKTYKTFLECETMPISPAGKAVVTTHGDLHLGNVIKSDNGRFYVVDFEQSHVSSAITDIGYFFSMFPGCSDTKSFKREFCASYLKEMGYPNDESGVFALQLDAEVCQVSTGFMSPLFETFMSQEPKEENIISMKQLNLFIENIRKDKIKSEKVVEIGMSEYGVLHLPFVCQGNSPDLRALVSVGQLDINDSEDEEKKRYQFLINGDGTIMPKNAERWKGLVLGWNELGEIVLTNHGNREKRLEISSKTLETLPITGYGKPKEKPFPMLLKNNKHFGKGIIRSKDKKGTFMGNEWCHLNIGEPEETIEVHFEKNGAIRLADRPEFQLCCDMDKQEPNTKITIYEYMDTEVHRFVRNEDDTISPKKTLGLILVLKEDVIRLEEKEKVTDEQRLVFDIPEGIGYSSPSEDSCLDDNGNDDVTVKYSKQFALVLDNPIGKGISFNRLELDEDTRKVIEIANNKKAPSDLKLCLVDPDDAARCQIDLTTDHIKIMSKDIETNYDPKVTSNEKPSYMIRYGCWN